MRLYILKPNRVARWNFPEYANGPRCAPNLVMDRLRHAVHKEPGTHPVGVQHIDGSKRRFGEFRGSSQELVEHVGELELLIECDNGAGQCEFAGSGFRHSGSWSELPGYEGLDVPNGDYGTALPAHRPVCLAELKPKLHECRKN